MTDRPMTDRIAPHLDVDLTDVADPFAAFARWREQAPVHRASTPTGEAVWLVTRHDDVRQLLADPRLRLDKTHSTAGYRGYALPAALDANLLNLDPPDHTRLRRLVAKAFTPRRVEELQPGIEAAVAELLDGIAGRGRADLVADLATPLPLTVIGELLGVPREERAAFRGWTNDVVTPRSAAQARDAITSMEEFLRSLIARKRAAPADDLISAMIEARDDQDRLSEDELTSLAFLTLWAGYEVTADLLGAGIVALLRHRAQFDLIREHPELAAGAVEELIRWVSPNPYAIRRFPTEPVTVGETTIPVGETVLLALGAADRDPGQFARPDEIDIRRGNAGAHLGFGRGIHYCLGAPLARAEVAAALRGLTSRFPRLRIDGPADALRWRASYRTRGLLALPVTF